MNRKQSHNDAGSDELLLDLFERITDELNQGNHQVVDALIDDHPQYAEHLKNVLPMLGAIRDASDSHQRSIDHVAGPAATLGDFQLIRELGRGGMGIVYEACQISLARPVAVKVLPLAGLLPGNQLQRFKNEAQAAASLHHPNIVNAFFVGYERGVHYYAMRLIDGQSLADVVGELRASRSHEKRASGTCSHDGSDDDFTNLEGGPNLANTLDTTPIAAISTAHSTNRADYFRSVATLIIQAANGLDYAHAMGVVHRDIKPSNLLIDQTGRLWITDFGLAATRTSSKLTLTGDLLGTLRYMSPEQADGTTYLDHRTDIYSLGAVLYELLTLEPPFDHPNRQTVLRAIAEGEPKSPRRIDSSIPRDLETIVIKATAKSHKNRYATAGELADDLQCYLDFRPIAARRLSKVGHTIRWVRRNPIISLLSTSLALTVVTLAVMFLRETKLLKTEIALNSNLQSQKRSISQQLYVSEIGRAARAVDHSQYDRARTILDGLLPNENEQEFDLRGIEWFLLRQMCDSHAAVFRLKPKSPSWTQGGALRSISFVENDTRLLLAYWSGRITVLDLRTRNAVLELEGDGTLHATDICKEAGLIAALNKNGNVPIWDANSGELLQNIAVEGDGHRQRVIRLSPDGTRLLLPLGRGPGIQLWGSDDRKRGSFSEQSSLDHDVNVSAADFSLDGKKVVTGTENGEVILWNTNSGRPLWKNLAHIQTVRCVRVSPDGNWVASCSEDGAVRVWHLSSGKSHFVFSGHARRAEQICFSPDSKTLISVGFDGSTISWNIDTGSRIGIRTSDSALCSVAHSGDGQLVATGDMAGNLAVWKRSAFASQSFAKWKGIFGLAFSCNSEIVVATSMDDDSVRAWSCSDQQVLWTKQGRSPGYCYSIASSPDGNLFAYGSGLPSIGKRIQRLTNPFLSGSVHLCDARSGATLAELSGHGELVMDVAFSGDGRVLASCSTDGLIKLWDVAKRIELPRQPIRKGGHCFSVAFSPSENVLAVGTDKSEVELWSLEDNLCRKTGTLRGHTDWVVRVAFSSDGEHICSASFDGTARIWNARNGKLIHVLSGHGDWVTGCAFAPDGKTLATIGSDDKLKLWNVPTGRELLRYRFATESALPVVAFSPDGRLLAASGAEDLLIWDTKSPKR